MFDYLSSIFLGLIQGLTEFLPISSSGHLVIFHKILNFKLQNDLSFDVMLHFGTLVALVIYFYKDIIRYLAAFFKSLGQWNPKEDVDQRVAWFIFLAAIPAGLFGYLLEDRAESAFRSPFLVAVMLITVGFLFILLEKFSQKTKEVKDLGWRGALIVGLAQVMALIPGVSRSGITILGGLSLKLKREEAARFSFLLSIPVIFGAVVKKMSEMISSDIGKNEWLIIAVGFSAALISGYLAIRFMLAYLKNHSLNIFAYYRFILGICVIIYFLLK